MFDIGFWELVTIGVIGIVVVGPDKLPEVVRSVVKTVRKVRRMFDDVKYDIERELDIDEMRRMVREADMEEHIRKLNQSVIDATKDIEKSGKDILKDIDSEINELDAKQDGEVAEITSESDAAKPHFVDHEPDPEAEQNTGIEEDTDATVSRIVATKQRQSPL